jgi:type I restriction enzyme S subunit
MKLETFFEKFDQFADAPNAVEKMRELVRHLAVTGKLVGQDPSDESGDLLLKKINAERLAAVKARQISPMKPLPAVGEEELLFELQPGWAAARLIELVMEIQTGPFGSSLHKSDYQLGGTPVINPASLKDGKIVPIDEMAIGHATLKRLEVFTLCAGDIVMARRGEMGRCAIVTKNEEGWLCGTGSLVLRMPRSLYAPYLAMLIGAPMARTYLGGASVGTTMQNLNQSILAKMPVGVPPLAEQKRIVAKVDELMALCDRLEAQQQERETRHAALARASLDRFADAPTPANLPFLFHPSYAIPPADLRKSILTLAVQGKLVPQDPNDEPAAELAERIRSERLRLAKTGKAAKQAEFAPIAGTAQPYDLPESWAWVPLGNVTFIRTGKLDANASSPDGQYPFFTCAKDPLRIDRYAYDGECVLLAGNGNFDVNYYDGKFEAYQRTYIIEGVSRDMVDGRYLFRFIQKYADTLREMSVGGVISYIKIGFLTDAPLPLPPLTEQRRIVAKVEQLMALVDALETQLAASRATAANLLSALVAELTTASANGAPPSQPGATPQVKGRKHNEG